MPAWIDIHTHLNMLEDEPSVSIQKARDNGVEKLITIGTCAADHDFVLGIAKKHYPDVYCTLGVHPHDAKDYGASTRKYLLENAKSKEVVAIGEIGLDYYYDNSGREEQRMAFRDQLKIAKQLDLPVEIHTRDAEEDTISILQEFDGEVKGLIHCFTGTQWLADEALKLGFNISISGVVTFKNASSLRETVKTLPLDRIHVETDSPFLTPVPFRGKKNTSAYVVHTAEKVAELKEVSIDELAKITKENALKMFPKIIWN